jgi:hypothetical protein
LAQLPRAHALAYFPSWPEARSPPCLILACKLSPHEPVPSPFPHRTWAGPASKQASKPQAMVFPSPPCATNAVAPHVSDLSPIPSSTSVNFRKWKPAPSFFYQGRSSQIPHPILPFTYRADTRAIKVTAPHPTALI